MCRASTLGCFLGPVFHQTRGNGREGEARVQFAHAFGAQGIVEPPCEVYRAREDEHAAGGASRRWVTTRGSDSAHEGGSASDEEEASAMVVGGCPRASRPRRTVRRTQRRCPRSC